MVRDGNWKLELLDLIRSARGEVADTPCPSECRNGTGYVCPACKAHIELTKAVKIMEDHL